MTRARWIWAVSMGGYAAIMVVVAVTVSATAWVAAAIFAAGTIPAVLPASRRRPARHSVVSLVRRDNSVRRPPP